MGDERGAWDPDELGGKRWSQREDVVDDHVRLQLAHQRERVASGVYDRLVEIQRLIVRSETRCTPGRE